MKLYVGNLGDGGTITSDDLRPLFETYGAVTECECIKNYAFVHMDDEPASTEAVRNLNGSSVKGRSIKVEKSESKGPRKPSQKLFVGNLAEGTTDGELRQVFERFAPVMESDVIKNFGFVHIDADAGKNKVNEILRELNGYNLNGSQIRVQQSTSGVRQKPGMGGDQCYRCGREGHWSKECPQFPDHPGHGPSQGDGGYGQGQGPSRGGGRGGPGGSAGRGGPMRGGPMRGGPNMGGGQGYGGHPYGGRGGQDPYPQPPPPSYVRERDNYGGGAQGGYGGSGGGGYNSGNSNYNAGPPPPTGGYGGGPQSYGGGGGGGGAGYVGAPPQSNSYNEGGNGYGNQGSGYGSGPSGYGAGGGGGGAGNRDNYSSNSGMNRGASTDAYGRPTAGPSHSSYDEGPNQRNYQGPSSQGPPMGGVDRRPEQYGRYDSPQHQPPQNQPPQQDMYTTRHSEPARGGYSAPGMSAGSSAPAYSTQPAYSTGTGTGSMSSQDMYSRRSPAPFQGERAPSGYGTSGTSHPATSGSGGSYGGSNGAYGGSSGGYNAPPSTIGYGTSRGYGMY